MVRRAQQRVRFDGNRRSLFEHFIQRAHKIRLFLRHRAQNRAALALHEQADVAARQTKHLLDAGNGAHMINIINGRVIHIHIALRDQKNALVFLHGPDRAPQWISCAPHQNAEPYAGRPSARAAAASAG